MMAEISTVYLVDRVRVNFWIEFIISLSALLSEEVSVAAVQKVTVFSR
jgi:hypothetical protein